MAILRCSHCQFLKEVGDQHLGKTTTCPACKKTAKVVDTLNLVKAAVQQYQKSNQAYKDLKQKLLQLHEHNSKLTAEKNELHARLDQLTVEQSIQEQSELPGDIKRGYAFENQASAAELTNFKPIIKWFKRSNIMLEINEQASDISGYFDEIAVMLGDNLSILSDILEGICYRQRKGFDKFTISLNDYNKADRTIIKQFCQFAYDCAFFSKYHWNKDKNTVFLQLNNAPQIQNFFAGGWLEWFGLMKVATLLKTQQYSFAGLRNGIIHLGAQNEKAEKAELDLFFLINDKQPLWIECKSGEFRDSINKYQDLRKRLNIDPRYALLLVSGLDDEKVSALNSMFKLTIVNEKTLLEYLTTLFNSGKPNEKIATK